MSFASRAAWSAFSWRYSPSFESLRRAEHDRVDLEALLVRRIPDVVGAHDAGLELLDHGLGVEVDAQAVELPVHHRRLEGEVHVLGDLAPLGDEPHLMAFAGQLLGQGDAHVVRLVVEDEDPVADFLAGEGDVLWCELPALVEGVRPGDGVVRGRVQTVRRPVASGGDDDDLGPVLAHLTGIETARGVDLDVLQLVELDLAVVHDPLPIAEPPGCAAEDVLPAVGEAHRGHPIDVAADFRLRLDEVDSRHLPLSEDHGALHAGRARPHDEHALVSVDRLVEALGMPAAPVLLAGGGVLRADHRRATDLPA